MMMSPDQFKVLIDTYRPPQENNVDSESPLSANSVAVKLPTFWISDSDLWFLQTEAVFANRQPRVTRDETKFNYVVMALPQEALNSCK